MISVDKIKENIKCPQFGDLNYGKWGAQKLEIREALKFMCDLYDSMDSIIKQQQQRIDKAIDYMRNKSMIVKVGNDFDLDLYLKGFEYNELLNILKGENKE